MLEVSNVVVAFVPRVSVALSLFLVLKGEGGSERGLFSALYVSEFLQALYS